MIMNIISKKTCNLQMLNTIYSAKYYRAVRYGKIKASTSGNSENVLTARNVRRNETSKKKKN